MKLQKQKLPSAVLLTAALTFPLVAGICCRREPPSAPPPASPQTAPSVSIGPATAPLVRRTFLDVVRANYREFPTTQPLSDLLDLDQAAHLQLHEPIYLSPPPRAELWITRPDAPPIQTVLREAGDLTGDVDTQVVDRRVIFVDWMPTDSGDWKPYVVCRRGAGGYDVFWPAGQGIFAGRYDYHWESAFAWDRLAVVPTTGGISIVDLTGATEEAHYEFTGAGGTLPIVPQALTDLQGIIAWTPWDAHVPGSGQATRFVNGKWSGLTADTGWPGKLVHVVPLLDGSALQLLGSETGGVRVAVATLQKVDVDQARIAVLVDQLNDAEESKRVDAYEQLTRYGPGIWSTLEKLAPDQPPEAADRLAQLLRDKTEPTLGGMKLLGAKSLTLADRLTDGGVIFYAPGGVSVPNPGGEAESQVPAWISVRPGEPIALLPEALTIDLKPETSRIWAIGDEWIVRSEVRGPARFVGNGFVDLLRKDETGFDELVGIDHRGRWVLQRNAAAPSDTGAAGMFLVLDPSLPDPTPRLPGWSFTTADSVGWDKDGWPVVKRGAAFALVQTDWRLMDPKEKIFSGAADDAAVPSPAATTQPASDAATRKAAEEAGPVILSAPNGTRYYDGQKSLRAVDCNGREVVWPLPSIANGKSKAHLIGTADGRLYLFNQGGRILRIRPTPTKSAPFEMEATFTRDVPDTDNPSRIWLDPAGRIDIEWGNRLTILFPAGYIPRQIAEKMETGGNGGP